MQTPQSALVPDAAKAGIFIEADAIAGEEANIKHACAASLHALTQLQQRFPDAALGLTIAFGSHLWLRFNHSNEGAELKPFRPLGNGLAPATQHDVMLHIASKQHDVNLQLASTVLAAFGSSITVANETHAFRQLEDRGFDGFVDGTENPHGDEAIQRVGVIGSEQPDSGGSYVLLQKYRHDLEKWNQLSLAEQEQSVGRSKASNEEFSREQRLPTSHLGRTNIKENGNGLKIVRRSLPYGTLSGEHGLVFIAYCARLHNIEAQLLNMFGETDGQTDLLLKHLSTAISGAYYYAPSVERLGNL